MESSNRNDWIVDIRMVLGSSATVMAARRSKRSLITCSMLMDCFLVVEE